MTTREKEKLEFELLLKKLDADYPGKEFLTRKEVSDFTGISYGRVPLKIKRSGDGSRYTKFDIVESILGVERNTQ